MTDSPFTQLLGDRILIRVLPEATLRYCLPFSRPEPRGNTGENTREDDQEESQPENRPPFPRLVLPGTVETPTVIARVEQVSREAGEDFAPGDCILIGRSVGQEVGERGSNLKLIESPFGFVFFKLDLPDADRETGEARINQNTRESQENQENQEAQTTAPINQQPTPGETLETDPVSAP